MHYFQVKDGELWAEGLKVRDLAEKYGTPLYIYSASTLLRHFRVYDTAFEGMPHLTCFSAKSNSNLSILELFKNQGAGVDIVSGGELYRALQAGINPSRIVFSGVGKQEFELEQALDTDILMFNVESTQELYLLNYLAASKGKVARISLRINPDVEPETHPYISTGLQKNKFGINMDSALDVYKEARELPALEPLGIDCHIGSQLTRISPFLNALDRLKQLYIDLRRLGLNIRYLDIGGGLGITYSEEDPPHPQELGKALTESLQGFDLNLIVEPGRVITGNAGILVTKSLFVKQTQFKNFLVVDAAMNDLIRPSLYQAHHRIAEVVPQGREEIQMDVVGPICESGDFLVLDRKMPSVSPGEYLAVFSSGAYAMTMASQYNSRPRPPEVLVEGETDKLIRRRERYQDLVEQEKESC